jgi:hypothetical protein
MDTFASMVATIAIYCFCYNIHHSSSSRSNSNSYIATAGTTASSNHFY